MRTLNYREAPLLFPAPLDPRQSQCAMRAVGRNGVQGLFL
jgi:hypothetical protein